MCGLAGVVRIDGSDLDQSVDATLAEMSREIAHRGPDDAQIIRDGPLGMAFRRLSIVDVQGGRQPITNEDGSIAVVANGEIYNHRELAARLRPGHRLRSRSDCEVLVHLYEDEGPDFVSRLVGMFALALWDRRQGRVLLARDRFGIKPLFYTRNPERIAFASEIKALLRCPGCPRTFDWDAALADSAVNATIPLSPPEPATFFIGVEQLPAGTVLEIDTNGGGVRERRYWQLPDVRQPSSQARGAEECIPHYRECLTSAVSDCLMSDVEVGIFLSGGVDSGAIAALCAGLSTPPTFTVLNPSTLANGDSRHASATAALLGLPNEQVLFPKGAPNWTADDWKRLVWLCESPLCGPEQLLKYELFRYARATRPELKVVLTGQGADEFNGGYSTTLTERPDASWDDFILTLHWLADGEARRRSSHIALWDEHLGGQILASDYLLELAAEHAFDPYEVFIRHKYRDLQMFNCWQEDRIAAGNGIENRVPFLDHRLVETVLSVPADLRGRFLLDKEILRAAVRDVLPEEQARRPKVPFFYGEAVFDGYAPLVKLLAENDATLLEEALGSGRAAEVVDLDAARTALSDLTVRPDATRAEFLLRLVNMGLLEGLAAAERPLPYIPDRQTPLRSLPIEDWDAERQEIALAVNGTVAEGGPSPSRMS